MSYNDGKSATTELELNGYARNISIQDEKSQQAVMSPTFVGPDRQQSDCHQVDRGINAGVASVKSEAMRDYANGSPGFKKKQLPALNTKKS